MRMASTPSSNTCDDEAEEVAVADSDDTENEDDEDAGGNIKEAMFLLKRSPPGKFVEENSNSPKILRLNRFSRRISR